MDEIKPVSSGYSGPIMAGRYIEESAMVAGRSVIVVEPEMTLLDRIKKTIYQWVNVLKRFILDYCCCCFVSDGNEKTMAETNRHVTRLAHDAQLAGPSTENNAVIMEIVPVGDSSMLSSSCGMSSLSSEDSSLELAFYDAEEELFFDTNEPLDSQSSYGTFIPQAEAGHIDIGDEAEREKSLPVRYHVYSVGKMEKHLKAINAIIAERQLRLTFEVRETSSELTISSLFSSCDFSLLWQLMGEYSREFDKVHGLLDMVFSYGLLNQEVEHLPRLDFARLDLIFEALLPREYDFTLFNCFLSLVALIRKLEGVQADHQLSGVLVQMHDYKARLLQILDDNQFVAKDRRINYSVLNNTIIDAIISHDVDWLNLMSRFGCLGILEDSDLITRLFDHENEVMVRRFVAEFHIRIERQQVIEIFRKKLKDKKPISMILQDIYHIVTNEPFDIVTVFGDEQYKYDYTVILATPNAFDTGPESFCIKKPIHSTLYKWSIKKNRLCLIQGIERTFTGNYKLVIDSHGNGMFIGDEGAFPARLKGGKVVAERMHYLIQEKGGQQPSKITLSHCNIGITSDQFSFRGKFANRLAELGYDTIVSAVRDGDLEVSSKTGRKVYSSFSGRIGFDKRFQTKDKEFYDDYHAQGYQRVNDMKAVYKIKNRRVVLVPPPDSSDFPDIVE